GPIAAHAHFHFFTTDSEGGRERTATPSRSSGLSCSDARCSCRLLGTFGYGVEAPPAFCPRTHAAKIFQSGSSWEANCLPPWCVSARPPTSGASGISSNRLCSGLPGVTSFETV